MVWVSVPSLLLLCACVLAVPPADWQARIEQHQMLFSEDDRKVSLLPSVGNGFSAFVIDSDTVYVAGLFNGLRDSSPSHRARIPSPLAISVPTSQPRPAALDVERGIYYRRTVLSPTAFVEQRWYAHRTRPSLLVMELDVNVSGGGSVTVPLTFHPGLPSADILFHQLPAPSGISLFNGSIVLPEIPHGDKVGVGVAAIDVPASLTAEHNTTFFFLATIRTTIEAADPPGAALADLQAAVVQATQLQGEHVAAWAALWQAGVEIAGRDDVAMAVNASLYYIISSVREDRTFSLSPGGLASNAYSGHTFWDCETWMYPSLLLLQPTIARSLLQYRFARLAEAHDKAQSYPAKYAGAMFPWESAYTGVEVCPTWAATGAREQHISGDVAFAVMQYWRATGDKAWLAAYGYPIVKGVADFWVSRMTPDPAKNPQAALSINDVIPPDEFHDHVNNSVYTNVVAQISLQFAAEAAAVLGQTPDPLWTDVAGRLVILFDPKRGIHPEYEGYVNDTIKQADVVLLGFPLGFNMSAEVRRNDLLFYAPVTSLDGPAMTWGMHAIGFVDLEQYETAEPLFNQSFANAQPPFYVWTETPKGGAVNFLTGAGGFLQTVTFGYPGIRIGGDGLRLKPVLPGGASFLRVRGISFHGGVLDLSYDNAHATVTLASQTPGVALVLVDSSGARHPLSLNVPVVFPNGEAKIIVAS